MKSTRENRDRSNARNVSQLLKQLEQRDVLARVTALEALTKIEHPSVFEAMIKALSDKNPTVRVTAAESLGTLNYNEAVNPLINKLSDSNGEVRMRAAESLGLLLGGRSSPRPLIKSLRDTDKLVRIAAAEALAKVGDGKALPALGKAMHDRSPLVRSYVAEAIGKLGGKRDIAELQKHLKDETSQRARVGSYYALYLLGQRGILQELLKLLQSSDYKVRAATANALSEIPASESESKQILRSLRRALKQEPTVGARSSIRSSLHDVSKAGKHKLTSHDLSQL